MSTHRGRSPEAGRNTIALPPGDRRSRRGSCARPCGRRRCEIGRPALDENLVAIAPFEVLDPRCRCGVRAWSTFSRRTSTARAHFAPFRRRCRSPAGAGAPTRCRLPRFGKRPARASPSSARIVGAGADTVRLTASVLDVGGGQSLGDIELRESAQRMDRLADSLTVRILGQLSQTRAIGSVRQGSFGATSLTALKAFLQGEQHYRRSNWDSATVYYRRAVEADSMFAPGTPPTQQCARLEPRQR